MRESDYGWDPPIEWDYEEEDKMVDEDGRSERLLPCGYEPGDCSGNCGVCGDNPANDPPLCGHCNGSGEGMHPGTRCQWCKGSGVEREAEEGPGPDDGPGEE